MSDDHYEEEFPFDPGIPPEDWYDENEYEDESDYERFDPEEEDDEEIPVIETEPEFMSPGSIKDKVTQMLASAGLTQESIEQRIYGASDPNEEVRTIFREAHAIIGSISTGSTKIEVEESFQKSMTDLINQMNRSKKLKATFSKAGEGLADLILSAPDIVTGAYQMAIEKSPTARKVGSWLAETFNVEKTKEGAKETVSLIDTMRMKGKETRRRGAHNETS